MKGRTTIVLAVCLLCPPAAAQDVVINEIFYEPPDVTRDLEFLELFNAGEGPVDLSGWYFSTGISYRFPPQTALGAGGYILVAENPGALRQAYGADLRVLGPYEGYLSNDGERITLRDALGTKMDEVDYQVAFPWPSDSAGKGGSMELIHPALDNDLGGSWRVSRTGGSTPRDPVYFIRANDTAWRYRKGTSEASNPMDAWRAATFAEDGTWITAQTSIGYGDNDDKTPLTGMLGIYTTVYLRHTFEVPPAGGIPPVLKLRTYVDDGCIVWINNFEVARPHVSGGSKAFNATADNHEAAWEETILDDPGRYLVEGTNILAIHALNTTLGSSDLSIDAELLIPGSTEIPAMPTPGQRNSVWAENAPPQIRQVKTALVQPEPGMPILITAKITDPEGVASAALDYQIVPPGGFIPAYLALDPAVLMANPLQERPPNPAFEDPANWTGIPMTDDGSGSDEVAGDGIWTAVVPAQANRTLVRWRITAADTAGASVKIPYPDDGSLNFAGFVYAGVPPYRTTRLTVKPQGPGYTYPAEVLTALPVYTLITRNEDLMRCIAYNGAWQIPKENEDARDADNWEGAFVHEGIVYDHIRYRLRQANDRYSGGGKRSWKVRFHKGYELRAKDNDGRPYPTRWRTLNIGKMFDNLGVGNFGMTESLNSILWNLAGVPAPFTHTFHFRVIDGPDEAPAGSNGQHYGDFWGMALAMEDYDSRFIDAHGMADGNLYKLKDGIFDGLQLKRNQGRFSVTTDEDFQNIRYNLRPERNDAWLETHVNYDRWFPYHSVCEGIRHYDYVPADSHSKNRAWFFEPAEGSPYGRLWTLPWDSDASWGPNWNSGIDYSMNAISAGAGKPAFKIRYRNTLREFRDLLWQEEVLVPVMDHLAGLIVEMSKADRDRWRSAPADAGSQDFGTMEWKAQDMKNFAFSGWTGGSGPTVGTGGRAAYLETLANAEGDAGQIPQTPAISVLGPNHFPVDNLAFESSPFHDPQGDGTFQALQWRLSLVSDPDSPASGLRALLLDEWSPVWQVQSDTFDPQLQIPLGVAQPGHGYRLRVRMMDTSGRWSHWSVPAEFTASKPDGAIPQVEYLRVTEIMYNPAGSGDAEYIELQNTGPVALDLSEVRFTEGVTFDFAAGAVTSLGPGEYVVVVKSLVLFAAAHDADSIRVAGEFGGKLDNGGETIALLFAQGGIIQRFLYEDSWHPATDGAGYSLVIADPKQSLGRWSIQEGWRTSARPGGSPGAADIAEPPPGPQLPSDLNQDGRLDLSDPIGVLLFLFQGSPAALPCGDGSPSDPGNRALLDANGDAKLDIGDAIHVLGYLFIAGAPPILGEACILLPGCPDSCR